MKLTTVATGVLLMASATSAASCVEFPSMLFSQFQVTAEGVSNGPEICGRLWLYLRRFPCLAFQPYCAVTNGNLVWQFQTTMFCAPGMVTSSWWEATHNKFGALEMCDALTRVSRLPKAISP
ncbi:hypothetical protein CSHISOI_02542 [Colletotrichum shisoi]|uniref:Secreted protein n=1 Tax=Colletotrichum shisoi TaxID=2078593 RepID=A0A5Q4C290_9PEZI|nr:hypothetical protein CSHISOI_02542 [Colletotrichum shisoi]